MINYSMLNLSRDGFDFYKSLFCEISESFDDLMAFCNKGVSLDKVKDGLEDYRIEIDSLELEIGLELLKGNLDNADDLVKRRVELEQQVIILESRLDDLRNYENQVPKEDSDNSILDLVKEITDLFD